MRDFNNVTIEVNDKVASYIQGYAGLRHYFVVGFTPKQVRVSHYKEHGKFTQLRYPEDCVIVYE